MTIPSQAVEITQKLVRFPSVTPVDAGAQDYLKSLLRPLGFDITDLPFDGNGSYKVDNFLARRGTKGPHLCFCGHTDVVPAGDEAAWSVPPFAAEIVDGKIIGRGVSDMKGQIAAFVAAVERFLKAEPEFNRGSISFLITGDEEKDSINGVKPSIKWMAENNHLPDACLVGEPSSPDFVGQEMKVGRRGSLTGILTVKGKQGHVAHPHRADNPLPRLVKMLDALTMCVFDKGSAWFQPTNLEITTIDVGNKAHNVIPAEARAAFNLRYSDRWTTEALEEKIRTILASAGGTYDISFIRGASPFLTTPGDWTMLASEAIEAITGHKPNQGTSGGTSDARYIAPYCPVIEFGMVNNSIHQVDEHCTIADLELCENVYHEILKRYFA